MKQFTQAHMLLCCHLHRLQCFLSLYKYDLISNDATVLLLFEVHIVVGFPLCFKYSRDDRHSIYLDVYCFWTAWHGQYLAWDSHAKATYLNKRIWGKRNTSMTWLTHTHTQALNGSSLSEWWAWERVIQMFQVKPRNGTFNLLFSLFPPSHTARFSAFNIFNSLSSLCSLGDVKKEV